MFVILCCYGLLLVLCTAHKSIKDQTIKTHQNVPALETKGILPNIRKRSVTTLFVKGVQAWRTVMTGAKQVRSQSPRYRRFEKKGDLNTALEDFKSVVDPQTIMHFKTKGKVEVWSGYVGDKEIRIRYPGEYGRYSGPGKPVLDVIDYQKSVKSNSGPHIDRIVYKE